MQEDRTRSASQEERPSASFTNFQLPVYRDTSRFSTTFSFYEFIDQELREEEERDMIILRIRENIIGNLVDELYERYMDRQVIPFTVRCFERSLRKLLNWYFLPRDPEDTPQDWEEDEPPPAVPVDNWASYSVPPGEYPPPVKFKFKLPFEDEEVEEEAYGESDRPHFSSEVEDKEIPFDDLKASSQCSAGSGIRRSLSEPGSFDHYADLINIESEQSVEPECSQDSLLSARNPAKIRKAHFLPDRERTFKTKREIYQWISPKNFPPVRLRVSVEKLMEVTHLYDAAKGSSEDVQLHLHDPLGEI